MGFRIQRRVGLGLVLCWALGAIGHAASTHQLVRAFDATAGGQAVSLPAGTAVEVVSIDTRSAMVRHVLPGGSTTLILVPAGYLKPLQAPAAATLPALPPPTPTAGASPPVPRAAGKSEAARLDTVDRKAFEGRILRIERRYVVIVNGAGETEDIPLKSLNERSKTLVERWKFQAGTKAPEADPRVTPGGKFSVVFPDLGASRASNPTRFQIRIPDNYQPGKPAPLALYLGGGEGTDDCKALDPFVDTTEWVTVAFPYSKEAPKPLDAPGEGKSRELIAFQEPMLERLQALLPDTDPRRRVVIGTSNGAHMIGIAACDGWKEFVKYFSAFVLHEGGGSQSRDFSELRRKDVFVLMGEKSESLAFSQGVVASLERARVKADVTVSPGEGHNMGNGSRSAIREWIAKLPGK